jgi:hypothetical protein
MTSFTMQPEAPVMNVVPSMAGITRSRQTDLLHRLGVTGSALQRLMFSRKRKCCLLVMIETPLFP